MNLLLLEPAEATGGRVGIDGRRADHLRRVLRASVGASVRAGVIGGAVGVATVVADDGRVIELELALADEPRPPMPVDLVLAMPRPKVLSRVLETAAAFGVGRIDLVNAWRVDKAYLASPQLAPSVIAHHLRLGAEQGVTTHVPSLTVHHRLMEFFDGYDASETGGAVRLCAHARGGEFPVVPIERAWPTTGGSAVVLAIGPEGGWIDRELASFAQREFAIVSLGDAVLRVEAALAAALGQVALLLRSRGR